MKILAFDPSLSCTGVAFPDKSTFSLKPPSKLAGPERLVWFRDSFQQILNVTQPDAVALEGYAFGKASHGLLYAGELGGILRVVLWEYGKPYVELPPSSLKQYATGSGNGDKHAVISSLSARTQIVFTNSDEADAWCAAALVNDYLGQPWLKIPATHHKAFNGVSWPQQLRDRRTQICGEENPQPPAKAKPRSAKKTTPFNCKK